MKLNSRLVTKTFTAVSLCVASAACSGGTPAGPFPTLPQRAANSGAATVFFDATAQSSPFSHVVYVSSQPSGDVYAYSDRPGHKLLEELTWQSNFNGGASFGLATDSRGNLYVALGQGGGQPGSGYVYVFAPGGQQAKKILDIFDYDKNANPESVAVSHDGYVAVPLRTLGAPSVMLFAPGKTTPCANLLSTQYGSSTILYGSAFDANDNLYVTAYDTSTRTGSVGEVRSLCHAKTVSKLNLNISKPLQIQVDTNDNLVVSDQAGSSGFSNVIDVFPPGAKNPSKVIKLSTASPTWFAFESSGSRIWVPFGDIAAEFNYPAGGKPITSFSGPYGSASLESVAVVPRAEP